MSESTPPTPTDDDEKLSVASEIINGRKLLGLTQAQLATQSGVSLSAIKGYEIGRNLPGARELRQICQVLRLSPNRLLFGSENPFPERTWSDSSLRNVEVDAPVARRRLMRLLQLLSSGECQGLYQIVHSLAVARHGIEKVYPMMLEADVGTGIDVFFERGKFIPNLHAALLVDTKLTREYAAALLVAADETDRMNGVGAAPKPGDTASDTAPKR